jgi:selenocysteine-specific elongation factor
MLPGQQEVRVRGLRAHNEPVGEAQAGQRVALNLSGKVEKSDIERGNWLVDPDCSLLSSRLDVAFSLLESAPFPLKHLAPVKLHIGAKRVAGRLATIDGQVRRLQPGDSCLAQLILDQPVSAVHGERFLLRDQAEKIILGGGGVLDPIGPRYGKARPGRLAWLKAMQLSSADAALTALLEQDEMVDLDHFWAIRNQPACPTGSALPASAKQFDSDGRQWAITQARWSEAGQQLKQLINDWHKARPESPGIKMTELKPTLARTIEPALAMGVLVSQLQAGDLLLQEGHIRLKSFQPTESGEARAQWQTIRRHLENCEHQIPLISELLTATSIPENDLRGVIKTATKSGDLHRLNDNRYALPEQLLHYSQRVVQADDDGEDLSVVRLKTYFGSGRKLTIELLEYFDSIHFTRRQGDRRIVLNREVATERFGR